MKTKQLLILSGFGLAWGACLLAGCASTGGKTGDLASAPDGAKLWAQNCIRCHNSRSPASYSEAQWQVAMLHMRVRAELTGEQQRAIYEFLTSSH
ncbi:MAG: cytochrome c [Verrucomicrobia bacterium]|nr:cytochrome c [Verrucomicrobiota bacterium]